MERISQQAEEKRKVTAVTGEGATSERVISRRLNIASVWELPLCFVIENNGYGLSPQMSSTLL
jgi:TPP-dependent pyruvate/acetoin dehydrogenase alpha subunit